MQVYTPAARMQRDNIMIQMKQVQATADEAKTLAEQAGTAAASVDEYMDALLGLDATDETEATDAE